MSVRRVSGTSAPPAPSTITASATAREPRIRARDDVEVDYLACGARGELRRDGQRE
jgi:hypothetical protein